MYEWNGERGRGGERSRLTKKGILRERERETERWGQGRQGLGSDQLNQQLLSSGEDMLTLLRPNTTDMLSHTHIHTHTHTHTLTHTHKHTHTCFLCHPPSHICFFIPLSLSLSLYVSLCDFCTFLLSPSRVSALTEPEGGRERGKRGWGGTRTTMIAPVYDDDKNNNNNINTHVCPQACFANGDVEAEGTLLSNTSYVLLLLVHLICHFMNTLRAGCHLKWWCHTIVHKSH